MDYAPHLQNFRDSILGMRLQTFAGLNNIAKSINDMLDEVERASLRERKMLLQYGMLARRHYTILRALHQGVCTLQQNWPNKSSADFSVDAFPNELPAAVL